MSKDNKLSFVFYFILTEIAKLFRAVGGHLKSALEQDETPGLDSTGLGSERLSNKQASNQCSSDLHANMLPSGSNKKLKQKLNFGIKIKLCSFENNIGSLTFDST